MARHAPYEHQLREACRLVTERAMPLAASKQRENSITSPLPARWQLVFQSRSGPQEQAWLGPDIRDRLREMAAVGAVHDVVIVPIGFLAENIEVIYDLDVEVRDLCDQLGINMVRTAVVGSHPRFVQMVRELIMERLDPSRERLALGPDGPWPDNCPSGCCPASD
jgi:ferrochelatase